MRASRGEIKIEEVLQNAGVVFQEEYLELNPTKNQNCDIEIEKFNKIMK